jgi:fatty acid desaturase 2 (delta-6 desaturase)
MSLHYSLVPVLGFFDWMGITWLGSIYVLGNLILSHTHLPVVEEGKHLHWVEYAFHHTTNIRSSWWVDWWTGHLNYQIEHHLFPGMPEYKNKLCREKTKAFAKKHNLPYYLCSYWEAVKNTYHNLENVSEEIRHIM